MTSAAPDHSAEEVAQHLRETVVTREHRRWLIFVSVGEWEKNPRLQAKTSVGPKGRKRGRPDVVRSLAGSHRDSVANEMGEAAATSKKLETGIRHVQGVQRICGQG